MKFPDKICWKKTGAFAILMTMKRLTLILRETPYNQFTFPVLLKAIEIHQLDQEFDIKITRQFSDLQNSIQLKPANFILYSFMTPQIENVLNEIKIIKSQINKTDLLICGGPHPTGSPESCLSMGFDIVFQGAAERTLPRFLIDYLNDRHENQNVIKENMQIVLDESFPLSSLSSFAPPLEITRGCFNRCKFCQTGQTQKLQHRSFESIKAYLEELVHRKYSTRAAFINPSGFEYGSEKFGSVDLDRIEALFALVRSYRFRHFDYGIFPAELNPNTVTSDGLKLIKQYCTNKKITIGAQSGTTRMMRKTGRPHTQEDIEYTVSLVHQSGLRPQVDIIFGFPEETEEDQIQSLAWMKQMHFKYNVRFQAHYFLPLAGSAWHDQLPTPLKPRVQKTLIEFNKAGISTNWWKKGMQLSKSIIETYALIQEFG